MSPSFIYRTHSVEKRSSSPPLGHSNFAKRFKSESSVNVPILTSNTARGNVDNTGSLRRPTRGAEFVRLPGGSVGNSEVNDLVIKTTRDLAHAGKRLVHAPRLLADGIIFDWVLDFSTKEEKVLSLLSVKGIDSTVVQTVLHRVGTLHSMPQADSNSTDATIIELVSDDEKKVADLKRVVNLSHSGRDATNPICIDLEVDVQEFPSISNPEGNSWGHSAGLLRPSLNSIQRRDKEKSPDAPGISHGPLTVAEHRPFDTVRNAVASSSKIEIGVEGKLQGSSLQSSQSARLDDAAPSSLSNTRGVGDSNSPYGQDLDFMYGDFRMLRSSSDEGSESEESDGEPTVTSVSYGGPLSSSSPRDLLPHPAPNVDIENEDEDRCMPASQTHSIHRQVEELRGDSNVAQGHDVSLERSALQLNSAVRYSSPQHKGRPPHYRRTFSPHITKRISRKRGDSSSSSGSSSDSSAGATAPDTPLARRPSSRHSQRRESGATHVSQDTVRTRDAHEVNIPRTAFARGRRLLVPADTTIPLATIAMRGDTSFIDQRKLHRISRYSLPFYSGSTASVPRVADACLLEDNTAVLGYDRGPCQTSLILPACSNDQLPRRMDLTHSAHSTVQERSGITYPNPGISALAPVDGQELRFLSGGHDKLIYLWTLRRNHGNFTASSKRLEINHSQRVNAVAYRAHDRTVFSAAGKLISVMNITHIAPDPIRVSDGTIFQVHVHPQAPQIVILEVDHMDRQILLYDTRKSDFDRTPCLEFGFRDSSTQPRTRFIKGSACHNYFVRPYGEGDKGVVRMWDYRRANNVLMDFHSVRSAPIVHAVISGSNIIAYGAHSMTIWKTRHAEI